MFQSSLCCYYWNADISIHMVRHEKHLPMFIGSKIVVHVVQVQNSRKLWRPFWIYSILEYF